MAERGTALEIIINEVIKKHPKNIVIFSTECGDAKAFWNGDMPIINKKYDVEIEIPGILIWGKNIKRTKEDRYTIGIKDNLLYILGRLESVEDDGYTIIRLGENIVPLEVEGNPPPIGAFVKVETNEITLYNVEY